MSTIWQSPKPNDAAVAGSITQFLITHPSIIIRDAVQKVVGAASSSGTVNTNTGSAVQWIDQPFTTASGQTTIGRIELSVLLAGSGSDITITLQTDSAGSPSGTAVTGSPTVVLPKEFVPVSAAYLSFPFPVSGLTAATLYHLIISGTSDTANYIEIQTGTTVGNVYQTSPTGVTWSAGSKTTLFHVFDNEAIGNLRHSFEDAGARWVGWDNTGTLPTTMREYTGILRSVRTIAYSNGVIISVT